MHTCILAYSFSTQKYPLHRVHPGTCILCRRKYFDSFLIVRWSTVYFCDSAMIFVVLASALLATPARAFYLPGVAPREFPDGGEVALKVDKLTSV